MLCLLSTASFSQNNGINPENSVVRLDYIAFLDGIHIFRLVNKQSCTVKMQYKIVHTNQIYDVTVPGNSSVAIEVPGTMDEDEHVLARATQFCPGVTSNQGWVEQDSQSGTVLPLKFEYLRAKIVDKKTVWVYFKVHESSGEKSFNIQISTDGKNFKTVAVVLPDAIVPNKEYSVKIVLK
jgi:hypothetical protein